MIETVEISKICCKNSYPFEAKRQNRNEERRKLKRKSAFKRRGRPLKWVKLLLRLVL